MTSRDARLRATFRRSLFAISFVIPFYANPPGTPPPGNQTPVSPPPHVLCRNTALWYRVSHFCVDLYTNSLTAPPNSLWHLGTFSGSPHTVVYTTRLFGVFQTRCSEARILFTMTRVFRHWSLRIGRAHGRHSVTRFSPPDGVS